MLRFLNKNFLTGTFSTIKDYDFKTSVFHQASYPDLRYNHGVAGAGFPRDPSFVALCEETLRGRATGLIFVRSVVVKI